MLRHVALVAVLLVAPFAALADEIATLPAGDPARAFELAAGAAGDFVDVAGAPGENGSRSKPFDAFIEEAAKADVLLLGEQHTHLEGHRVQARILEALAARREIALGMEFFESEDDPALARYVAGETDLATMLEQAGWYESGSFNFEYYRAQVEACRKAKAPVFGLNVPRTVTRTVSRQGMDALTPEQKALVGELGPEDPAHRFLVAMMVGGMSAESPQMFDGMLRGQNAWDAAMSRSVLRARDGVAKGRLIVVIVGVGHVAHGRGIPARLRAAAPDLRVVVACPVVAEEPAEDAQIHPGMKAQATAVFSRGYGDWVMVLPDEKGAEEYPTYGVTLEPAEKGLKVLTVEGSSVADRAGLKAGDVIVSAFGKPMPSKMSQARLLLAESRWGTRVELGVRRGETDLVVPVILVPATDGPGRWLASEPVSTLLDSFDPLSSRAVTAPEPAAGLPQARLVKLGEKAVRVDVFDGQGLAQAWMLDGEGRPVLGLLARPDEDGAVRVELDRGPAGEVKEQRRFDAKGAPVVAPATKAAG